MTKYFYLKLGKGNCLAEYWLNPEGKRSIFEEYEHAAAIYFGIIRAERIREFSKLPEKEARELFKKETPDRNRDFKAAKNFVEAEKDPTTKFVTISNGRVYFYKPIGAVSDMPEKYWKTYDYSLDKLILDKNKKVEKGKKEKIKRAKVFDENNNRQNIPKIIPIEIIKQCDIAKIPHVLASLPCNQHYTQHTCQEIREDRFLFNWNKIFEIDSLELRKYSEFWKFLMDYVDGDWKEAPISKTDGDNFIVSKDKKLIEFTLNEKKDKVTLKVDDKRIHDFIVKKENGKLNVYKKEDWGAIQAIKHCLNEQIGKPENASELMSFLSPYELETLVFLILKNACLFVPAWRGGTQKDIDIIGRNFGDLKIEIPPVVFEPKGSAEDHHTFQVKRKVKMHIGPAEYTVAAEYYGNDIENVLNAEWLLRQLRKQEQLETRKWFTNSLRWVKEEKELNTLIDEINC